MKGGDRKSYNDWIRKVMARQTREHKHKKRIVRTLIFPAVLYGCETWTMTKKMEERSMHVKCGYGVRCKEYHGRRRRLMKVYVRMEIGIEEEETLHQTALRRKVGFFGHVMRLDGLEKGMMLAHGDGRRRRGRPRRKWIDEIHEVTGIKLAELRDVTTEKKQWRRLVKTVARAVRDLGVTLDSALTFSQHISNLIRSSYFQLRRLRTIRKAVSVPTFHLDP